MACCGGDGSDRASREVSKQIDQSIKLEHQNKPLKLLLLGAGDVGKSTFVKQMQMLFANGFSKSELVVYSSLVKESLLVNLQRMVQIAKDEELSLPTQVKKAGKQIELAQELDGSLLEHINTIWKNKLYCKMWKKRDKYGLHESVEYFIKCATRICEVGYVPTEEDVLRLKIKTTGIKEIAFTVEKADFLMVDVGGQRSERRKWLHCFTDVTAVIFLASLDAYDQVLEEDQTINRMKESLELFFLITSSKWLKDSDWILFLNKIDLFKEKLQRVPLSTVYPEYRGKDVAEAVRFIKTKYQNAFAGNKKIHKTFVTCALDTSNCRKVFQGVKAITLSTTLSMSFDTS